MALGTAKFCIKECVDHFQSHSKGDDSPAKAYNVHVVVFDPLVGRKCVVNQCSPYSRNLVCGYRRAYTASANCNPPINLAGCNGARQRNHKIRVVVFLLHRVSPKSLYRVARGLKSGTNLLFNPKLCGGLATSGVLVPVRDQGRASWTPKRFPCGPRKTQWRQGRRLVAKKACIFRLLSVTHLTAPVKYNVLVTLSRTQAWSYIGRVETQAT